MNADAISPDDLATVGVVATIALVVIGVVIGLILTALVARVITAVVIVVLGIFVWQQRSHIENEFNDHACNLDATYFGITVDPPDDLKQRCAQRSRVRSGGGVPATGAARPG